MTSPSRLRTLFVERGGMIALAVLVFYIWVAPPYIVDGDNAELATLGTVGGVAHPSGYPLYLLWLRAMSWLPAQSPAHAAAIATAILGAAQIWVLHAACRAWGARALAATIAVGLFAAGPIVMRMQVQAEVFALNSLIAAAVLWIAADRGPLRGLWRAAALGLVAGLGLSNHLTCVLVAPIGIVGVARGVRETTMPKIAVCAMAVGTLAIGLLPYAYLLVTSETLISWGHIDSLGSLYRHFVRADYGTFRGGIGGEANVPVVRTLAALIASAGRSFLWLPLVAGVGALAYRIARPGTGEPRSGWIALALSFVLAGPLLLIKFDCEPTGVGLYIVRRFHILPLLVLVIPVAVGIDHAWTLISRPLRGDASRWGLIGSALAPVGFVAIAMLSLPELARIHTRAVEQGVKNMLRTLPPNAVVLVTADEYALGCGYVQDALGERPDVDVVVWPEYGLEAYRERANRRLGIVTTALTEREATGEFIEQVFAKGRPLFIDGYQGKIAKYYPNYPFGLLFRVLPKGSAGPTIEQVLVINKALFARFDLAYPRPDNDSEIATKFHTLYARVWTILAQGLEAKGNREDAAYAIEMARALGPE
jgi:hypothetical protein